MFDRKSSQFRVVAAIAIVVCLTGAAATQVDWKTQIKNMPPGFALLATASPQNGQAITWDGTKWAAGASSSGVFWSSSDFDFATQHPSGTLTAATPATVTLAPVPRGVNGTDANHYLYLPSCSGGAQAVLITGGTAVSGSASGTVTFTPTNSCTAGWTISSATSGIKEASKYCSAAGGAVQIPGGVISVHALLDVSDGCSIRGSGPSQTILNCLMAGRCMQWLGTNQNQIALDIRDFEMIYPLPSTDEALYIKDVAYGNVDNLLILSGHDVMTLVSVARLSVRHIWGSGLNNGINLSSDNASLITQSSYPQMSDIHIVMQPGTGTLLNIGPQLAGPQFSNMYLERGHDCIDAIGTDGRQINEALFVNVTCDGYDGIGLLMQLSGGTQSSRWHVANSMFNGGTYGMVFQAGAAGNISAAQITGNTIGYSSVDGIRLEGVTEMAIVGNQIYNSGAGPGGQAIELNTVADSQITISGNGLGIGTGGTAVAYGVLLGAQAHSDIFITGNQIFFPVTAPISDSHTGSGKVEWSGNKGVDDVTGTITVSTNTAVFPVYPNGTFTSTAAISAVSGLQFGARGTFVNTNATPGAWSAGATIGNACTVVQNALYSYYFDGTKIWISGKC